MGRGLPTLEEEQKAERKGRSEAEVCTSEARKIGDTPCEARSGRHLSVLSTCVTKQTGDMVYSEARRRRFLSFGQRTTMLYALERESDHGSDPPQINEGKSISYPTHGTWTTKRDLLKSAGPFCFASCSSLLPNMSIVLSNFLQRFWKFCVIMCVRDFTLTDYLRK
jgi:hypothetical protein